MNLFYSKEIYQNKYTEEDTLKFGSLMWQSQQKIKIKNKNKLKYQRSSMLSKKIQKWHNKIIA